MDKTTPFTAWLHCLLKLAPPGGLLHVGAGSAGQTVTDWKWLYAQMPRVLAVEAQAEPFRRLQAEWAGSPHVEVQQGVVAGEAGPVMFHHASIRAESGLCAPEHLQRLWPNIRTTDIEPLQAVSLAELLLEANADGPVLNWLAIDCLPGGPLLRAADAALRFTDVVVVRALDTPAYDPSDGDAESGLQLSELQPLLEAAGFEWIGSEEEDHPGLVRAVFARSQLAINQRLTLQVGQLQRDQVEQNLVAAELQAAMASQLAENIASHDAEQATWGQEKAALTAARDEQEKLASEAQAQRDGLAKEKAALTAARDEQAKLASEAQAQRDGLAKEKAALTAACDAQVKAKTEALAARDAEAKAKLEAVAARDAQAKLAAERLAALDAATKTKEEQSKQLLAQAEQVRAASTKLAATEAEKAQLTAERDTQAKAKAEALAARDAEAKAKLEAIAARDAEAKAKLEAIAAHDAQAKLATERMAQIKQLEQRINELNAQAAENEPRQQMLQQELYRAEVQIDLIKDLLLREPGL